MDWVTKFYADVDSLDVDRVLDWFAEDVELQFGNRPAIVGKGAVASVFGYFNSQLTGITHIWGRSASVGEDNFVEGKVSYGFKDGRKLTVPAAVYLRKVDRLVQVMRVFVDMNPGSEAA